VRTSIAINAFLPESITSVAYVISYQRQDWQAQFVYTVDFLNGREAHPSTGCSDFPTKAMASSIVEKAFEIPWVWQAVSSPGR
jgi:hypothetical protein